MASKQSGVAAKPTFAKVAASAYMRSGLNQSSPSAATNTKANPPAVIPRSVHPSEAANPPVMGVQATAVERDVPTPGMKPSKEATNVGFLANKAAAAVEVLPSTQLGSTAPDASSSGSAKPPSLDDGSTQVSSSDGSMKQPAFDSKSVASVTTFAMDEKESLRPDDSASIRAVEDEDQFSAPGTGAAGSRIGSDTDARAFSDQLREISVMAPRGVPAERYQPASGVVPPIVFGEAQMIPTAQTQSLALMNNPIVLRPGVVLAPDEKLMEALASHRDRLFVLKLEQDIIDFIRDSDEMRLILPQTHSFYRMLAHKLADYYSLNHMVDQNDTGAAVIIEKTNISARLPPPLSGLPNPATAVSTPPPNMPARKIMRRDGNPASGTSTSINSEGPSKTTSEAGDGSGSSEVGPAMPNGSKSKSGLSREEREAKYKEARERIFGMAQENEEKEDVKEEENDVSRSSSAAGKKKSQPKKQKTPIDDDFEPRSQFTTSYYGQSYATNGFAPDATYLNSYPAMMGTQMYAGYPPVQGQPMYPGAYPQLMQPDPQMQYATQPHPFIAGGMAQFAPASSPAYDMSAQFQRAMQTFQTASPPPQSIPKMASPVQGGFSPPQSMQMPQYAGWQQMGYTQPYSLGSGGYSISAPLTSPPQMASPYMYAASPGATHAQPVMPDGAQNYHRGSFNPQSQSFVPGSRGGPPMNMMPLQQAYGASYLSQMPGTNRHAATPNGTFFPHRSVGTNGTTPPSQGASSAATSNGLPPALPQPPNPDSSIAKWGTPSHLPPKPPPPASMEPQKYNELNRGLQGFPGLPRITGNSTYSGATGANSSPSRGSNGQGNPRSDK